MLIACDFDGTVTVRDCLNLLVQRFAPEAWAAIEPRLRRREIGLVEAIAEEFRHIRVTERDAVEYVMSATSVRPGFAEFVAWCEDAGHVFVIVSAGFRVLIDPVLRAAGLSRLRIYAGDARFTREGTTIWYPPTLQDCASRCGTCKAEAVQEVAAGLSCEQRPLVVVGDGLSDLCLARQADLVFARGSLARLLHQEGLPFVPFKDFFEIRRELERRAKARE